MRPPEPDDDRRERPRVSAALEPSTSGIEPSAGLGRPGARELAILVAILAFAAILRLPGLDQRGAWDADQGTDMLVLQGLVDRGEVPLLGPRTSIGTFHHGAVYYYLLAPAAFLSGSDPVAVTSEIALFGLGAVAATWWLARLIGGPRAGLAAALLMAVSPAGIEASTFIWNPNLIPFASAVAFAAALHAVRSRHARWWLLSAVGAMVVMQCHVLGVVVVPPLVVAWLVDVRRRRRRGERLGPAVGAGVGGLAIIAAGYLAAARLRARARLRGDARDPRLRRGWRQRRRERRVRPDRDRRAAVRRLAGRGPAHRSPGALPRHRRHRLRPRGGRDRRRPAAGTARRAWLAGSIGWSIVALALFAPSLAVITPGLPNDHYHSFLDPLVLALVGAGLAGVARGSASVGADARPGRAARRLARLVAAGLGTVLVAVSVIAWPPAVSPDGGWRLADQAAGETIATLDGDQPMRSEGIPPFKSTNAMRFPLEHRGFAALPRPVRFRPDRDRVRPAVRRRGRCRVRWTRRGRAGSSRTPRHRRSSTGSTPAPAA